MSSKPTPLWPAKQRRLHRPHPHLPKVRLDPADRAAIRKVCVYSIAAVLAALALTVLIVVVCLWVRLALFIV